MRVLLISANRLKPSPSLPWTPVAPLGLAYVAASLRASGHEIELVDLCFVEHGEAKVREAVESFEPEVIGVSLRNIDLMAYFNSLSFVDDLRAIVEACRSASTARIVLGGSGFSAMPEELLRFTGLDLGIAGEGEWSFPELLARIEREEDCSDIPGVVRRVGREFRRSGAAGGFPSLVGRMRPARDLIDNKRYAEAGGSANIQTKRGCPFGCIYCTYPLVEGAAMRCRPPEEVESEFREIAERYGINTAYVVDNQFNYPPEHAKEVCEKLIAHRDEYKIWWNCMLNPGQMSEELGLLLRLARCASADLSIESASDAQLERLGKNFRKDDVRRALATLNTCRLSYSTWVLFGGPGETARTIRETLDFLVGMNVPEVICSVGLRICPGTELARIAHEEGVIDEHTDLVRPTFYLSMDAGEIVKIIEPYLAGHARWRIAALARRDT